MSFVITFKVAGGEWTFTLGSGGKVELLRLAGTVLTVGVDLRLLVSGTAR